MRNTNKKGFTIVELVIVVAVIAILAAVLIPTFSSIIKKANIASDTAVAKNLNTAAISASADTFDQAIAAVKDAGYLLANLNAKADGCYFVWDDVNNQFLLVDTKNDYKVIYSNTDASEKNAKNWLVAVSDLEAIADIEAAGCGVKKIITSTEDLKAALTVGGEVYVDESVILDKDNVIVIKDDSVNVTLNLGESSLNTNGILDDTYPIELNAGTLTINDGVIGVQSSSVDADGLVVNIPVWAEGTSNVNINGTTFYVPQNGYIVLGAAVNGTSGKHTVTNATINAEYIGLYADGFITIENTVINSKGRAIWACNHNGEGNEGLTTIKSGTYIGGNSSWATITTCGGFVEIEGGDFIANEGTKLFQILDNGELSHRSTVVITGGTFNGVDFADLDEAEWNALCGPNTKATISADGKTVTIGYSAE